MVKDFRFICPMCGMLGHGTTLLKKEMPTIQYKIHRSRGRGTLTLEPTPARREWNELLAARLCAVIQAFVAADIVDEGSIGRAVAQGKGRAMGQALAELLRAFQQ